MKSRFRPGLLVLGLTIVVGLPFAGKWLRGAGAERCALSGLPIEEIFRVRIRDCDGRERAFCCIRCAQSWLALEGNNAASIRVTDEISGAEIDVGEAVFVLSSVRTNPVSGNRLHVFQRKSDAAKHIGAYGGWVVTAAERPFRSTASGNVVSPVH